MILPDRKDAIHKAWLYRLLAGLCDDRFLSGVLVFKGGTCAAMRGVLDRFSVDLDFDYLGKPEEMERTRTLIEKCIHELGLTVKDRSDLVPHYFLKYPNQVPNDRNTLKIDVTTDPPKANVYEYVRLQEIDRIIHCHSLETMFANKMVAMLERHEIRGGIAGRDLYDIHHFFMQGIAYSDEIIKERRKTADATDFLKDLIHFIDKKITQTIINQDLNVLLPPRAFNSSRQIIKKETLMLLQSEIDRRLKQTDSNL